MQNLEHPSGVEKAPGDKIILPRSAEQRTASPKHSNINDRPDPNAFSCRQDPQPRSTNQQNVFNQPMRMQRPDQPMRMQRPDQPMRMQRPNQPMRMQRPGQPIKTQNLEHPSGVEKAPGDKILLPRCAAERRALKKQADENYVSETLRKTTCEKRDSPPVLKGDKPLLDQNLTSKCVVLPKAPNMSRPCRPMSDWTARSPSPVSQPACIPARPRLPLPTPRDDTSSDYVDYENYTYMYEGGNELFLSIRTLPFFVWVLYMFPPVTLS